MRGAQTPRACQGRFDSGGEPEAKPCGTGDTRATLDKYSIE
jgi:hypothetical protein